MAKSTMLVATVVAAFVLLPASARTQNGSFCGGGFTHLAALCALHRDPAARVYGSAFVQKGFLAEAARDAGRAERSLQRGSGIIDVFTGSKARTKTTPPKKKGRGARRRGSESTAAPSAAPGGSNRRRGSESSAPFVIAVVVGVFAAAALYRLARAARARYRRCPLDEAWAPDWAGDGETRDDLELVDARPPDAAPRFTRERELVHLFDVDSVRSSRGRAGSDLV